MERVYVRRSDEARCQGCIETIRETSVDDRSIFSSGLPRRLSFQFRDFSARSFLYRAFSLDRARTGTRVSEWLEYMEQF
jgi:hypothetical protein